MKLRELAEIVGGEVVGDGDVEVTSVAEPAHAGPGALVMVRIHRDLAVAEDSGATALLLPDRFRPTRLPAIVASDLRLAFARALGRLHPAPAVPPGVHPTAVIGGGVTLGAGVAIGPHTVIGDGSVIGEGAVISALCAIGAHVSIGAASLLYPRVTIYEGCTLGQRVILHAGVVVGADGFGYAREGEQHVKIPHVGRVVIEDDVEIGANSAIDRATLGETRVGAGSKIDNLVQIAHNVTIGRNVLIAGMCGIAGSATIGDGAILAGDVGVVDHVTIGAGAVMMARAAAHSNVPPGAVMSGSPARDHREELRLLALMRRLPDVFKRLRALERPGRPAAERASPKVVSPPDQTP